MSFLKLKCTKFDFCLGSPRWGSLQRSHDLLAGFNGAYFQGRDGREGEERGRGKGKSGADA